MRGERKRAHRPRRDSDHAPEITDKWIAGADLYRGKKLVRRGKRAESGQTKNRYVLDRSSTSEA
jgi:hypothetical protein